MLNARYKNKRSLSWGQVTAPLGRPGARYDKPQPANAATGIDRDGLPGAVFTSANTGVNGLHPLTSQQLNAQLYRYENDVKARFDAIESTVNQLVNMQYKPAADFEIQALVGKNLGIEIPRSVLEEISRLNAEEYRRKLYAWCLFCVYQDYSNSFTRHFPLATGEQEFQSFIQDCGFHTVDISPCADGRLAHVVSYVLRMPYRCVRRKSYAGAMFDIDDSMDKWVEVELKRFREGRPNTAEQQTRYLKAVVYHFSSQYPDKEGCAAHGSNAELAARAGRERLNSFKQAVENTYCCGASIDQLLIGLDTDTDVIRIHVPDEYGEISLTRYIDASEIYKASFSMQANDAREWVKDYVEGENARMEEGLARFISYLLVNNMSQIDYVRAYHSGQYEDIGHAERFIGVGKGFEEVQLRNLTFFSYLKTVEESVKDLDVGIKIFTGLNINKGLPVPVVVRFDYHGKVPGSRERAIEHCRRVNHALHARYKDIVEKGFLYTLMVIRDLNSLTDIESLGCSLLNNATLNKATQEAY